MSNAPPFVELASSSALRKKADHSLSLFSHDVGALSLFTLFFLIFFLAGIAALLGINFEIRLREGLQDGSDAIAFSAAVILARGMNLLVLFNQIMMLLIAILIALRLAQTFLIIASIVAAALAWVTFGASLAVSATLATTAQQFGHAYRTARPIVFNGLRALESAQAVIKNATPAAAAADSLFELQNHNWISGAFALPSTLQLPVEKDEFSVLCGKSSQWVLSLALGPLTSFSSEISEKAKSGSEKIGQKTSGFLCGDPSQGTRPPRHQQVLEERLPETRAARICKEKPQSATCRNEIERAEAEAPHPQSGECPSSSQCQATSPYFILAAEARRICAPAKKKVLSYQYQKHHAEIRYSYATNGWQEVDRKLSRPRLRDTKWSPCGPEGSLNKSWDQSGAGTSGTHPICDSVKAHHFPTKARYGDQLVIQAEQMTRIFSCVVETKKSIELAKKEDAFGKEKAERGPQKIKDELLLGSETFQVRSLSWGNKSSPIQPQALGHSSSQKAEPSTRFAFSQAEYFFEHDPSLPRSEWLWERRWKARLRQVRWPEKKGLKEAQDQRKESKQCNQSCSQGFSMMQNLQGLFLH